MVLTRGVGEIDDDDARRTGLLVGQLAGLASVTVKTVRHYERLGFIVPIGREANGYKRYAPGDAVRVACIASLRRAGLPLSRTAEVLDARPDSAATIDTVLGLLKDQRDRLTAQIDALASLQVAVDAGEGPLEELGKPVVADIVAALGDLASTVDDRAWRLERRVIGILAAVGTVVDEAGLRRFVSDHREEVTAMVATDAAFAELRDAEADDPRVRAVASQIRQMQPLFQSLGSPDLGPPTAERAAAVSGLIQPRLSAAQREVLRLVGPEGARRG